MARIAGTFVDGLFELLASGDEAAVQSVLFATFGAAPSARVCLVEADLTVEEALRYVCALSEFGREEDAAEVFAEIVRTLSPDAVELRAAA